MKDGDARIHIIDATGKLIFSRMCNTANGRAQIPMELQPGVYMLQVIQGKVVSTQKIIVQ
jgi:hypothetical protein